MQKRLSTARPRYLSYHYDVKEHEAPNASSSGIPKSMDRTFVVPLFLRDTLGQAWSLILGTVA